MIRIDPKVTHVYTSSTGKSLVVWKGRVFEMDPHSSIAQRLKEVQERFADRKPFIPPQESSEA